MKKIIAILFIVVFSLQALPVRAVGKLLSSGQMTEDVQHTDQPAKQVAGDDDGLGKFCPQYHFMEMNAHEIASLSQSFHITDEALIKCHHLEVLLQPPNA